MNISATALLDFWWIFCAMLVFLMQAGFIFLETGSVEYKHFSSTAQKNVAMFFASTLAYGTVGFRIMYGDSFHGFFGNPFATIEINYAWLFYQTGFAAVAATIISGAIAGRTTLIANIALAAVVAGVVYPTGIGYGMK